MAEGQCSTGITRAAASLLGVLVITLVLSSMVQAEAISRDQPRALVEAEWALEQGDPERALTHLRRQRALLRQPRFRQQADALACEAYRQVENWSGVSRTCAEEVAYEGEDVDAQMKPASVVD